MFGELDKLLKKTWYNNPDNHFINISTETHNSVWQVFSIYHIPTKTIILKLNSQKINLKNLLKIIKNRSSRKYKLNVTDKDKLVVHAKFINIQKKKLN